MGRLGPFGKRRRAGGGSFPRVALCAALAVGVGGGALAGPDPLDVVLGEALFEKLWVASPSSTKASDGLGPLYNARSCAGCHVESGRGVRPSAGESDALIASFPDPDPIYGAQVQTRATQGLAAEAALSVTYEPSTQAGVNLRAPRYTLTRPAYGAVHAPLSVRLTPPLAAVAAIAALPEAAVRGWADPGDADGDGISGRLQEVDGAIGRFGYRAIHPDAHHQSAAAFSRDLGLSTPLFDAGWGDCTEAQAACRARPHGDGDARVYEVDAAALDLVVSYLESLAPDTVPPEEPLFEHVGCAACHKPAVAGTRGGVAPFTDLLLHDMGAGLSEPAGEGVASGREWRTAPLLGLRHTVARGHLAAYLHDGRARTIDEAIAWHGGEGAAARDAYFALGSEARARLLDYLEGL